MVQQVLFVIQKGFSMTTLAVLSDALFVANWQSGRDLYRWHVASCGTPDSRADAKTGAQTGARAGFNDIAITARPLSDFDPHNVDIVVALSSFEPFGLADAPGMAGFLRSAHRFGARIAGLETGGVALARAGLLDGRAAAIHWANRDGFAEAFPDVTISEAAMVQAGRCITSAGGIGALDLALHLIEEDAGRDLAKTVAIHMLKPDTLSGTPFHATSGDGAAGVQGDALVTNALRVMADTLDEPLSIAELAHRLGTAQRSLQRRFTRVVGRSPQAQYLALRLTRAQNLLQQTTLPVGDIAVEVGFDSLPAFSRAYKHRFGISPRQDRQQTTTASVPRVY